MRVKLSKEQGQRRENLNFLSRRLFTFLQFRKRLLRIKKVVFNNMVRSYKRKTVNKYSEEMLSKTINDVQAKKLSMRKASVRYLVSKIFGNYFTIILHNKKCFMA